MSRFSRVASDGETRPLLAHSLRLGSELGSIVRPLSSVSDKRYLAEEDEEHKATEKSLLRKLDLRVSFLIFMTILSYVDRSNATAARLRGFEEDLGLRGTQFSSVLSIFYVSFLIAQVPANMLFSQTNRPSLYLGCALMAPGIVTVYTGLVTTYHGALWARLLLGFVEAPLQPAAMFFLGRWYKRSELSVRMTYLACGIFISVAFGSLIASVLLDVMDGVLGLPAWRWLFFVEGGLSVVTAIAAIFILPDFPETKYISWLTPEEHMLARERMMEDSADPSAPLDAMSGLSLAVSDWKVWYMTAAIFLETLAASYTNFFPTLTGTMGYGTTVTLLLCAPPWLAAAASSFWLSKHSDKVQERCWHIVVPFLVGIFGFLLAISTTSSAVRYVSLFLMAQSGTGDGIIFAWTSSITGGTPTKRAAALALVTAISQSANILGSYVWVAEWGPSYTRSFAICMVALLLPILMCLYLREVLMKLNREMDIEDEIYGVRKPFATGWRYHV